MDAHATEELHRGRDAFRRGAWDEAFSALTEAAQGRALESQDMDVLADCAYYTGRTERCAELLYEQHAAHLAAGRVEAAAVAAYRLHMLFAFAGEAALAAGWLGRAGRALESVPNCVVSGYVALAEAEGAYLRGEVAQSLDRARRARQLAERHTDADVAVVAVHLEGRALLRLHDVLATSGPACKRDECGSCGFGSGELDRAETSSLGLPSEPAYADCDAVAVATSEPASCPRHDGDVSLSCLSVRLAALGLATLHGSDGLESRSAWFACSAGRRR